MRRSNRKKAAVFFLFADFAKKTGSAFFLDFAKTESKVRFTQSLVYDKRFSWLAFGCLTLKGSGTCMRSQTLWSCVSSLRFFLFERAFFRSSEKESWPVFVFLLSFYSSGGLSKATKVIYPKTLKYKIVDFTFVLLAQPETCPQTRQVWWKAQ